VKQQQNPDHDDPAPPSCLAKRITPVIIATQKLSNANVVACAFTSPRGCYEIVAFMSRRITGTRDPCTHELFEGLTMKSRERTWSASVQTVWTC